MQWTRASSISAGGDQFLMTPQFLAYFGIATLAWIVALMIINLNNVFDLSRCVGWYMFVFLVTYVLRPAGSELIGDNFLYVMLGIDSFEKHWTVMAIAVPSAVICYALGY